MPLIKTVLMLAALAILAAFSCSIAGANGRNQKTGYVPIFLGGGIPSWLYPGKKAVYNLTVGVTNSRVKPQSVVTIKLKAKPPQMALLKDGSKYFRVVAGKPVWTFRNVKYHTLSNDDQALRITFYVSPKAKAKSRFCLVFTESVTGATTELAPMCLHVFPGA